jgi:large subunit ribosomal protein L24e
VVFRRAHRKGITEEVAKRRTRRTVKHQRAIVGASMEFIKARRNQRPAARATAQSEAIKKAKAEKAAKATKAEKSKSAKVCFAN